MQGRFTLPARGEAGKHCVEEADQGTPREDRQGEDRGHGEIRDDPPRKIVLATPGRGGQNNAKGDAEKPRDGLLNALTLDQSNGAGDDCDGGGRDEGWHEGVGCDVDDDEDQPGSAGLNDAACAAQGLRPREFLGGSLAHPARRGHQPSPAMTWYRGLMMTVRSPTRPTVPSTSRR